MANRYTYLYERTSVYTAFLGAASAYVTMVEQGSVTAEKAMESLERELHDAETRLKELRGE